jgi:protein involved in polysaccharide export with SLBB domain
MGIVFKSFMKFSIKYIFLFMFVLGFVFNQSYGQGIEKNSVIDLLSEAQFDQFLDQYQLTGLNGVGLETKAKDKGLSNEQINAIKSRINLMNGVGINGSNRFKSGYYLRATNKKFEFNGLKLFGEEIFDTYSLSFEPNINAPAPMNYILGTGDQLIIDVFGVNERIQKSVITTDGVIKYPNLGPINIAGLTLEEAKSKIEKSLIVIYPEIRNGKTKISVSMGQMRSISVTMIGDVIKPGTYTIPSLSTLMNALYVSGGPSENGTFRDSQLIRNGKVLVRFDLYDFLLHGDLTQNKVLRDDDVIKIGTYSKRVMLNGAVKRPAVFDVKPNETVLDIINYAGGFSDNSIKEFISVFRYGSNSKETFSVKSNEISTFSLESGDEIMVRTISNFVLNKVTIKGGVYLPGVYDIIGFPTLSKLLKVAKLNENAFLQRGTIKKVRPDFTIYQLDFNVKNVLEGKTDITLSNEDEVLIYNKDELKPASFVTITGEVQYPGAFSFTDSMKLVDLVLLAKGYKEGASFQRVELSRRIKQFEGDSSGYSLINKFDVDDDFENNSNYNILLSPYDIVNIRKLPSYKDQRTVNIEGEVLYPGQYTITTQKETLSDLIKRAGGFTKFAFAEGATLVRNSNDQNSILDKKVIDIKKTIMKRLVLEDISLLKDSLIKKLALSQRNYFESDKLVNLDLQKAIGNPGSIYDILIENGDFIKVPKKILTVETFGEVNIPIKKVYEDHMDFLDIIDASGGFTPNADKKRSFVIDPNGAIHSTVNFLFFNKYPPIKIGSELYILPKQLKQSWSPGEIAGTAGTSIAVVSLLFILLNFIK